MPTSAAARAGASLMPSPAIATVRPSACSDRDEGVLLLGLDAGAKLVDSRARPATVRAVSSLSPVSMMIRSPRSWRLRTASGVEALIGSDTAISPASRPSTATCITVRPCRCERRRPGRRARRDRPRPPRRATPALADEHLPALARCRGRRPPSRNRSRPRRAPAAASRRGRPPRSPGASGCSLCCSTLAAQPQESVSP